MNSFTHAYLFDMIVDKLMGVTWDGLNVLHSIPVEVTSVVVTIYTRPKLKIIVTYLNHLANS